MSKWDKRFLALAEHVASWSKDPSTQVGAVIVQPWDKIVVGMGYNGFPRGVEDMETRLNNRERKYAFVVHAELNAILNASAPVRDCTIYVWPQFYTEMPPTCNECAKAVIQAGITRVVGNSIGIKGSPVNADGKWVEPIQQALTMYKEAGVEVSYV